MSIKDQKYLFANWKMYLDFDESNILANALAGEAKNFSPNIKMAIFPSALSFYNVSQVLHDVGICVGAQNVYWTEKGGYTGEISAQMYKSAGADYVLVGHSERRHLFHETNHDVRQKIEAALAVGLTPVVCVGETAEEKNNNQTEEVLETQLRAGFHNLSWPEKIKLIIAYEPVWAIGTNNACEPIKAEKKHELIKKMTTKLVPGVDPIILYGGSVGAENVSDYLKNPNIDGVLVGGSSAKLDSWMGIVDKVE
ncbi:MAG: triose-phosphate isomerase [Patescibacteria group bacterium]